MTKEELVNKIIEFVVNSPDNYVSEEDAIYPGLAGMQMYEAPIVGFASADDELFTNEYKKEGIIHPEYMAPKEWLPGSKTVVSFFIPFTEEVKASNKSKIDEPYAPGLPQKCSAQWMHARVEGQAFLNKITDYVQGILEKEGFATACPTTSEKFRMIAPYVSNWSERHAAYAAGLGTFGLSKGLITSKGMAGRFGSVITDAEFEPTVREYSNPFEYCTMCGACMGKCPAGAIDKSKGCALGKDQLICGPYLKASYLPPHGPNQRVRYGCGKCQVGVPCENGIPKRNFDVSKLEWTRKPAEFSIADGKIEIVTNPHTDLWQRTYYHFRNDNAPVLQMETDEKYFSFIVKTEFESKHRFDQCGIVMYLDSENWLKGSIEYENEVFQHLGSVVTNNGYSDWATTEIDASIKSMWYRFSRREDDYCIECSEDGIVYKQMRICHMVKGNGTIRFGIYACSPEESSFKATFTNMKLTECKWLAHDGQKPDFT